MVDQVAFAAFSDELVKIASTVAQMRAADAAMKIMKSRFPGMSVAQQAATASKAGRGFSTSLVNRLDRAFESTPNSGLLTKAHKKGIAREMAAKSPTRQYVEEVARRNPDIVDPATGKKRGFISRFRENWRRGQAYQLPPAPVTV